MLRLDGNPAAGLLHGIFGRDTTTDVGTCASCGAREPVGAVHVYRSAGLTFRCPHCETVLIRLVAGRGHIWLDFSGLQTLELDLPPD